MPARYPACMDEQRMDAAGFNTSRSFLAGEDGCSVQVGIDTGKKYPHGSSSTHVRFFSDEKVF